MPDVTPTAVDRERAAAILGVSYGAAVDRQTLGDAIALALAAAFARGRAAGAEAMRKAAEEMLTVEAEEYRDRRLRGDVLGQQVGTHDTIGQAVCMRLIELARRLSLQGEG
jgi:hypothetical protein